MDRREFVRRLAVASTGISFLLPSGGCATGPDPSGTPAGHLSPRVALLAPLSGPLSGEGRQMDQAARLVVERWPDGRLITEDTGETPLSASRAAERAVARGATCLAGPVLGDQTAAVWRAVDGRVPVYSLSNDPALLNAGIRLVGITPDESTLAILGYAASRGVRKVAVLGDGDEWSRHCAAAAAAFAGPLGLQTGPVIQALAGEEENAAARIGAAGSGAVLIPPGGAALARLAPFVNGAAGQLLGTHQWTQAAAHGTAPPGGWFSLPDPDASDAFADRFRLRYGASPGYLAALAHDAVLAAFTNAAPDPVRGATGQLRFAPDGGARRGLAIAIATASGSQVIRGATWS